MYDKKEIITLLFIITLGIFLLFFMNILLEPKIIPLSKLNYMEVGSKIKTVGEIEKITTKENLTIINIKDETDFMKIIIFEKIIDLYKNDIISVEGNLIEYRDELEIDAEEIIKLSDVT